jgi:hypothetical protein
MAHTKVDENIHPPLSLPSREGNKYFPSPFGGEGKMRGIFETITVAPTPEHDYFGRMK